MKIIAIDPGTYYTAYVELETSDLSLLDFNRIPNPVFLQKMRESAAQGHKHRVIEQVKSYGNVIGDDLLHTVLWSGRFIEASEIPFSLIPRKTVCMEVCRSVTASDKNVRAALIDLYAERLKAKGRTGESAKALAIGSKYKRGPLYGMRGDEWAALGVAIAHVQRTQATHPDLRRALM